MTLYLPAMAVSTCLGHGKAATIDPLMAGSRAGLRSRDDFLPGRSVPLGGLAVEPGPLPSEFAKWDSRNNRLLAALALEIEDGITAAIDRFGPHRIAVVIGTSTSGIAEGEAAVATHQATGIWPDGFHYRRQETGSGAAFLAQLLGISGPAYVVATACSSSAKALASARRLIRAGVVDAAIAGGADTLCRMTVAGFASLEALSSQPCNPFSVNRSGITIGEGGALFLLTPDPAEVVLAGIGETSDAHHVSAPDPDGKGALDAMTAALADAALSPTQIGYVNLHGTATPLNDAMESKAVAALFDFPVTCGSTKAMTGHTLGAAGAVEAAFLWMTLSRDWNPDRLVPPHPWDGIADPALPPLAMALPGARLPVGASAALSNSFAFGGSNCCVALRRGDGQ
ncbi:beta-ketoacyl-[acyl-carrier-protein] synthase II [Paramagnetospirillum kuznetsovii]|uniref:Beta-ketoacyl-[acyl-carrier-protein] synthase II n=1 Tax=Paramagnetospirillum kuznetsovii TaxID=2053833 RepID=A0A364NUR2_9PROT|nr:beta-ketoacyl-ACP synthase [Paramagnetospirillum kuznetsovii]RAU20821.1 beta-ketoacyl-[acyl-carrier-protein] synthase II [Paramagnetospirillum kuznetsovii]